MNQNTQEKWNRFKANRRGFISLWIFLGLFTLSLFAEFIANDRPLFLFYKGQAYFPVFFEYPENEFGGELDIAADYRDAYIANLVKEQGFMIWPLIPYNFDTINYNLPSPAPSPPTYENLLGTDDRGRDILVNIIYGFRISVLFGLILTFFSTIIGVFAGAVQGYYGGALDIVVQRFMEVWSGMPTLFILIIFLSIFEPGFWMLLIITLLFSWMSLVGVVRAEFLRGRNYEYVLAAKAMGQSDYKIMFMHILPNAMIAALTFMPFILGGAITTLTSLDFLGFGLPSNLPSLGKLLAQGKANLHAPWIGISTFIILALMLSLLVFIGEAVRDAFDPRKVY